MVNIMWYHIFKETLQTFNVVDFAYIRKKISKENKDEAFCKVLIGNGLDIFKYN